MPVHMLLSGTTLKTGLANQEVSDVCITLALPGLYVADGPPVEELTSVRGL